MGLFTNPCTDPECKADVWKRDRFCAKCGAPSASAWVRCGNCGRKIKVDSKVCRSCGNRLRPESIRDIGGGRWARPEGAIAERFNVEDVSLTLRRGVTVEAGTLAILLEEGEVKDILGPGRYDLSSLADKVRHWGVPPPRTVIVVDSGEITLDLTIEGLRDSKSILLDFCGEAVIRIEDDKDACQRFISNLFKGAKDGKLEFDELIKRIKPGINSALAEETMASSMEELIRDPRRRIHVEDRLNAVIQTTLTAWGFKLVRVPSAEFTGKAYESLRETSGKIEIARQEYEFLYRMRELATSDRLKEIEDDETRLKAEVELGQFAAELAQEKSISDEKRRAEMEALKLDHGHDLERKERAYNRGEEMTDLAHRLKMDNLVEEHTLEHQRLKDAYAEAKEKRQHEFDSQKTRDAQELARERRAHKREHLEKLADLFKGKTLEELIAVHPDPSVRKDLMTHAREVAILGAGLPPELVAAVLFPSPETAAALTRVSEIHEKEREKLWIEKKEFMEKNQDMFKEILTKLLEVAKGHDHVYPAGPMY